MTGQRFRCMHVSKLANSRTICIGCLQYQKLVLFGMDLLKDGLSNLPGIPCLRHVRNQDLQSSASLNRFT